MNERLKLEIIKKWGSFISLIEVFLAEIITYNEILK